MEDNRSEFLGQVMAVSLHLSGPHSDLSCLHVEQDDHERGHSFDENKLLL